MAPGRGASRRRGAALGIAILATLLLAPMVGAEPVDPRLASEQPAMDKNAFPPKPAKKIARTGELKISPETARPGDVITATFLRKSGSVFWHIDCPTGGQLKGSAHKLTEEEAKHLPLGAAGGPTSCSFKAPASTGRGWASVNMYITGPCGDLAAVHPGGAEFAACTGTNATDSYMVIGKDDSNISGRVRGTRGEPVAGLHMEITNTSDGRTTYGVTDAIGHYGFWLKEGSYTVRPTHFDDPKFGVLGSDDFIPGEQTIRVNGTSTADFVVKGRALGGRVADTKGKPLAGAVIEARSKRGHETAVTGDDGRYTLTLPQSTYVVRVTTPAPPDPKRNNRFWGAAYTCAGAGKSALCNVDLSSDHTSVDFTADSELKVKMEIADKPDAAGRRAVAVHVTDVLGNPVGGQSVQFKPQSSLSPRMLVENDEGARVWPDISAAAAAIAAGSSVLSEQQQHPFTLTTDDEGSIDFECWPGSQSGEWKIEAAIPDSTDPTEQTSTSVKLPEGGSTMPDDKTLGSSIDDVLQAGIPHPAGNPNSLNQTDPNAAQDQLLGTFAKHRDKAKASLTPIHTSDRKHAAMLFMPQSPPDSWLGDVGRYMADPKHAAKPAEPVRVMDVGTLMGRASSAGSRSWSDLGQPPLEGLDSWLARAGNVQAQIGSANASGDAQALTYFGFPPIPEASGPLDRAAGVSATMTEFERNAADPLTVAIRDSSGHRVGDPERSGAEPVVEIPGASVETDQARGKVIYRLPRPDGNSAYSVDVTGTADGKAVLSATGGDVNQSLTQWKLNVKRGVSATGKFDGSLQSLVYDGHNVERTDGATIKAVTGLPRAIPQDSLSTYPVTVTDGSGSPVPHAHVTTDGAGFTASAWTNDAGKANLTVFGPPQGQAVATRVEASRFLPLVGKLTAGPPQPPTVPAEVRKLVGPEEVIYNPRKPNGSGPLAIIEMAAVLAISSIGIAFARRGG